MKHFPSDPFTAGFITAAFWTNDDAAPPGEYRDTGRPADMLARLPAREAAKAAAYCDRFRALPGVAEDLERFESNAESCGHDLWLSCNGHGSGYWNRYSQCGCAAYEAAQVAAMETRDFSARDGLRETCPCPYHAGERLHAAAKVMGGVDLYRNRGRLYFSL